MQPFIPFDQAALDEAAGLTAKKTVNFGEEQNQEIKIPGVDSLRAVAETPAGGIKPGTDLNSQQDGGINTSPLDKFKPVPPAEAPAAPAEPDRADIFRKTFNREPSASDLEPSAFEKAIFSHNGESDFMRENEQTLQLANQILEDKLDTTELVKNVVVNQLVKNGIKSPSMHDSELKLYINDDNTLTDEGKTYLDSIKTFYRDQKSSILEEAKKAGESAWKDHVESEAELTKQEAEFSLLGIKLTPEEMAIAATNIRSGKLAELINQEVKTTPEAVTRAYREAIVYDDTLLYAWAKKIEDQAYARGLNERRGKSLVSNN